MSNKTKWGSENKLDRREIRGTILRDGKYSIEIRVAGQRGFFGWNWGYHILLSETRTFKRSGGLKSAKEAKAEAERFARALVAMEDDHGA